MSFLCFCRTRSVSWATDSLYWGRDLLLFHLDVTQCLISAIELIFCSRSMTALSHISLYFAFFSVFLFYFFLNFHSKYVQSSYWTFCALTAYILSLYFCAILWVVSLELSYPLQHNYWVFNLHIYMFVAKECMEFIYKVNLLLSLNCLSLWTLIHGFFKFNLIL